ncbi:hypothetical protein L1887_14695 [Cichorium endivia]|nr:hypothetical protein L1887_14695 [Cichorium endivia]
MAIRNKEKKKQTTKKYEGVKEFKWDSGKRKENISFADVFGGNKKYEEEEKRVGEKSRVEEWGRRYRRFGISKYLGGLSVLFDIINEEEEKWIMASNEIRAHFRMIRRWDDEDNYIIDRFAWIRIEGIPIFARNSDSFINVGKLWGEVVAVDPCSQGSQDWSYRVVCIKTKAQNLISESIEIRRELWSEKGESVDGRGTLKFIGGGGVTGGLSNEEDEEAFEESIIRESSPEVECNNDTRDDIINRTNDLFLGPRYEKKSADTREEAVKEVEFPTACIEKGDDGLK